MDNEQVDIIDEAGQILRQALKTDAHKHGWLHKTAIGFLKYGDDFALVRQSSDRQDAGQLVAPVGGHIQAGEDDLDGLFRESEEEIGTRNITVRHIGKARFHRQIIGRNENHLFVIYEIETSDPIKLGSEAIEIEHFSPSNLKEALIKEPQNFGDALYFTLEHFYPEYLPAHYVMRWT